MPPDAAPVIRMLADCPELIEPVSLMRWREWGTEPGREQHEWWGETTRRESGRDTLPITWVAVGADGSALGAVGLGEFDIEERKDRSPWVLGMIVQRAQRGRAVGRRLLSALEAFAATGGRPAVWVATGDGALGFYQQCGWRRVERLIRSDESQPTNVLVKELS